MQAVRSIVLAGVLVAVAGGSAFARDGKVEAAIRDEGLPTSSVFVRDQAINHRSSFFAAPSKAPLKVAPVTTKAKTQAR
ncbi:hypothetical protein [Flaviflagellibacter deserti]|uniref:Uncharacterized protein n=1 Tax=Flaviflagellibacter deserti TaxID=2267266 RepID=A0ABV9Z2T2_9HYPH